MAEPTAGPAAVTAKESGDCLQALAFAIQVADVRRDVRGKPAIPHQLLCEQLAAMPPELLQVLEDATKILLIHTMVEGLGRKEAAQHG